LNIYNPTLPSDPNVPLDSSTPAIAFAREITQLVSADLRRSERRRARTAGPELLADAVQGL
jgi:hypothetical protein